MLGASPIVPSPRQGISTTSSPIAGTSPIDSKSLKHPKTGTSVEEAVAKASLRLSQSKQSSQTESTQSTKKHPPVQNTKKYTDVRSPDVSPTITYIPRMTFEELKTPNVAPHAGPGLSVRLDNPSYTSKKHSSSPESLRSNPPRQSHSYSYTTRESSYDDEPQVRVVIVEPNGDGTYSPKVEHQHINREESRFSNLNSNEKMRKLLETCREIRELATLRPDLHLDIVPDDGSVPLDEAYTYLEYARDTAGREDKMNLLELGIEAIYNLAAYVIERMFHIPMKDYFDGLKGRIRDYRNLLVQNVTINQAVNALPSVVAPNTSIVTILSIFVGQLIIGCVAAGAASYLGGGAITSGAAKGTAVMASNQLNGFLFGDITLLNAITRIGGNIFKKNDVKPTGPVEVT